MILGCNWACNQCRLPVPLLALLHTVLLLVAFCIANQLQSHQANSGLNFTRQTPVTRSADSPYLPASPELDMAMIKRKYGDVLEDIQHVPMRPVSKLPPVHQEVHKWFEAVDTKNGGRITAKELQQAFLTFQGRTFSDATCKFVVRLFDLDKNGGLDIREFEILYFYVKRWVQAFNAYDIERTGYLDEVGFKHALEMMDIHFTTEFINFLMARSHPGSKRISLDQYIITCIQIQRYTEEFKNRDAQLTGNIMITYEDFLELVMRCL